MLRFARPDLSHTTRPRRGMRVTAPPTRRKPPLRLAFALVLSLAACTSLQRRRRTRRDFNKRRCCG